MSIRLKDGVLDFLDDCIHELAGKEVPLFEGAEVGVREKAEKQVRDEINGFSSV